MPWSARAGTADDLKLARLHFERSEYRTTIRILKSLLYPLRLREEAQIAEARELNGASLFFIGDKEGSQKEFEELLYLRGDPDLRLDPLIYPPKLVAFFDKVRERVRGRIRVKPRTPETTPLMIERLVERNYFGLALVPFGVGQFQNRRTKKGYFFLATQAALLATDIVAFAMYESKRMRDGTFAERDLGLARALHITQIASLSLFGAIALWGIVDAIREYKPQVVTVRAVPIPEKPDGPGPVSPPSAPAAEPPRRPREETRGGAYLLPIALPGGAGLSAAFTF